MAAVLVHIDLDGDRPHPSSLEALAAGRAVASSWGATLYAALVVTDPSERGAPDSTSSTLTAAQLPGVESVRAALARGGADKVVVAMTDAPVAPLWAAVGGAWQSVLDHLRPRLVVFGADAPSAAELGPRTGARIGARLLVRARAVGIEEVELRDRDGGSARASDGGAAVALVGAAPASPATGDDDIDVMVLAAPGGADDRIELVSTARAEVAHTTGALVALADDAAADPAVARDARHLAAMLGAQLVGSAAAARSGAVPAGAVLDRNAPVAPELCVAIGLPALDVAGAAVLVRIGAPGNKGVDGSLAGPAATGIAELVRALDAAREAE